MEKAEQFIKWFTSLGGFISEEKKAKIRKLEPISTNQERSFKDNPGEVKARYNHKFEKKICKDITDYPDIDSITFEKP